jgi:hypothetical protein
VKGWDAHGREIELMPEQADIVTTLLSWHDSGKRCILPAVGRGAGKTVILHTVFRILQQRDEQAHPLVQVSQVWRSDGYDVFWEADLPEGKLEVTSAYQALRDEDSAVLGYQCTSRSTTLNGEPAYYPRNAELAARAGIAEPGGIDWAKEPPGDREP